MLKLEIPVFYKVKKDQTLREIATAFCVAERLLAKENALEAEPREGTLLRIPSLRGNAYTAGERDSKALLCGSEKSFREKNGTDILYPGMRVIL